MLQHAQWRSCCALKLRTPALCGHLDACRVNLVVLALTAGCLHAGVHDLVNPVHRVHHPHHRDGLHHGGADVLPAGGGGPPLVVALLPVRRRHRSAAAPHVTFGRRRLASGVHFVCQILPSCCNIVPALPSGNVPAAAHEYTMCLCFAGFFVYGYCFYYFSFRCVLRTVTSACLLGTFAHMGILRIVAAHRFNLQLRAGQWAAVRSMSHMWCVRPLECCQSNPKKI